MLDDDQNCNSEWIFCTNKLNKYQKNFLLTDDNATSDSNMSTVEIEARF